MSHRCRDRVSQLMIEWVWVRVREVNECEKTPTCSVDEEWWWLWHPFMSLIRFARTPSGLISSAHDHRQHQAVDAAKCQHEWTLANFVRTGCCTMVFVSATNPNKVLNMNVETDELLCGRCIEIAYRLYRLEWYAVDDVDTKKVHPHHTRIFAVWVRGLSCTQFPRNCECSWTVLCGFYSKFTFDVRHSICSQCETASSCEKLAKFRIENGYRNIAVVLQSSVFRQIEFESLFADVCVCLLALHHTSGRTSSEQREHPERTHLPENLTSGFLGNSTPPYDVFMTIFTNFMYSAVAAVLTTRPFCWLCCEL